MAYALHNELTDATLEDAFISYPNKRTALRMARMLAKSPSYMVARIVVFDTSTELSIATFECPKEAA